MTLVDNFKKRSDIMRSRYLMELTTPEVEEFFKNGGKTAILPVGSVECGMQSNKGWW